MGLLDLPAPLFAWVDGRLAGIAPPTIRLILWAIVGAIVAMALYRVLSPQARIAQTKQQAVAARRALAEYDGEFAEAWPLMRRMMGLSLRQLALVIGPTIVASLPLLCLLVWLSSAYGHSFPPSGAEVPVRVSPPQYDGRWIGDGPQSTARPPRVVVADEAGAPVIEAPLLAPIPILHKRQWWNALTGNPAGYLPADAPVDSVEIGLPAQEYIPVGPTWLRSWYVPFFVCLLAASLATKIAFRIE